MSEINCPHCGGKFHCGMVDTGYIGHVPVIIIANDDITLHSAVNLMTEHEMIHKEVIARNDLSTEMHRSMREPLPEPIR